MGNSYHLRYHSRTTLIDCVDPEFFPKRSVHAFRVSTTPFLIPAMAIVEKQFMAGGMDLCFLCRNRDPTWPCFFQDESSDAKNAGLFVFHTSDPSALYHGHFVVSRFGTGWSGRTTVRLHNGLIFFRTVIWAARMCAGTYFYLYAPGHASEHGLCTHGTSPA